MAATVDESTPPDIATAMVGLDIQLDAVTTGKPEGSREGLSAYYRRLRYVYRDAGMLRLHSWLRALSLPYGLL